MNTKERITRYIELGAMQRSRKYRRIGVPPILPNGETYFSLLQSLDPVQYEKLEQRAKELIVDASPSTHVELTHEEFDEWLRQTGRKPWCEPPKDPTEQTCDHLNARPPNGFDGEIVKRLNMTSEEVRKTFPRFWGKCPDCGVLVTAYVSREHFVMGDW